MNVVGMQMGRGVCTLLGEVYELLGILLELTSPGEGELQAVRTDQLVQLRPANERKRKKEKERRRERRHTRPT